MGNLRQFMTDEEWDNLEFLVLKNKESVAKIIKETELQKAMTIVCKALKEDKEYYNSWQASIAMSFKNVVNLNMLDVDNKPVTVLDSNDLHILANNAADNFLKLLIG